MADEHSAAAIVIGGTGMLAKATRWLAARSTTTLVVGRRASRFTADQANMVPVNADWNDVAFATTLQCAIRNGPSIGTALIWLHDPERVLAWLSPLLRGARVVLVLGALDGTPRWPDLGSDVATVCLGSIATAQGRRWLSDDEISDGAIAALQDGRSRIIGDLGPAG